MGVTSSGSRVQGASSLLIAQLARGTRRQIEQAIAPTGLRPTELLVLQHLRERGPSAQQTLTVLNSLEDQGLIDRRRDRADRRRAIIALSPPGELLLADLDRSLLLVDDQILAPLTGAERQTLHALLTKAVKHIGPESPPPPGQDC
jgi:MarR family transcriptional regulator, lower aerobic nicotinate degradation pathway regulator